jgi:hypothetical protein
VLAIDESIGWIPTHVIEGVDTKLLALRLTRAILWPLPNIIRDPLNQICMYFGVGETKVPVYKHMK